MITGGSPPPAERPDRYGFTPLFAAGALILAGLFIFFRTATPGIADAMRLAIHGDDAMRLVSVRNFLAGQSWFDMTQYRYLPPTGVSMHWSRLVDLPIASGILALTPFLGADLAERVTVTAWPLLLFLVYAGVIGFGAWRLFGPLAAGFAIFIASQAIVFGDLFAPGRIDHHNVQVILVTVAVLGFAFSERDVRAALVSGTFGGFSLAIGLETLPCVALLGIAFVVAWIANGERASRALRCFGLSLAVAAAVFFVAQTAPSAWSRPRCDELSTPLLLLTTGGAVAAAMLSLATAHLRTPVMRTIAAALSGAALIAACFAAFPVCLNGPYSVLPQPYLRLVLDMTVEAFPFWKFAHVNPSAALQSVMPMLAAALAVTLVAWRGGERRAVLALLASLLWLGAAMAAIQIRAVYVATAFVPLAAGWFLDRLLSGGLARASIPVRALSAVGGIAMFGIVWAELAAAIQYLAPADQAPPQATCSDPRNVLGLNALPTGVILAQIDIGSEILLQTRHSIIVGGYHVGPAGIIAAFEAFDGDEAAMRRQVDKFHADYLAICASWLPPGSTSFAKQLTQGRSVPWLQPLDLATGPLQVWRVVR